MTCDVLDKAERSHRSLLQRVWEQSVRHPDSVAIVDGSKMVTYAQLLAAADRAGRRLADAGAGPVDAIPVIATSTLTAVTGWLACLHAGAGFVPMDPCASRSYNEQLVSSVKARCVVADTDAAWTGLPVIVPEVVEGASAPESPPPVAEHGLCYVLFTSGSTARPKGVVVEQQALLARLTAGDVLHRFTDSDVMLQLAPLWFDVSIWEVFTPLVAGARLVVADSETRADPLRLGHLLREEGVTDAGLLPRVADNLAAGEGLRQAHGLRRIYFGAEYLSREVVERVWAVRPDLRLFNLYGLTETCIDATAHECSRGERGPVPIGRPLPHCDVVLLEPDGRAVTTTRGEIAVGGGCLAHGYLGDPEGTARSFVTDPRDGTRRLFRTGDAGAWRTDGELLFLGRLDRQVKVRGHRIDLSGIETLLRELPGVAEVAVVAKRRLRNRERRRLWQALGDDSLSDAATISAVGRRVAEEWQAMGRGSGSSVYALRAVLMGSTDREEIERYLSQHLPAHMIPEEAIVVEHLPVTTSGKIDLGLIEALAQLDENVRVERETSGSQELTTLDAVLSAWRDALEEPNVSPNDDFLELGGESLVAAQIAVVLSNRFNVDLCVRDVLEASTPAHLTALLGRLERIGQDPNRPSADGRSCEGAHP